MRVEKRDGRLEDFDRNKISGGVVKAGAPAEVAASVAVLVESWAQKAAENETIKSSDIRNKVIELLRLVDREAANAFETYKKTLV